MAGSLTVRVLPLWPCLDRPPMVMADAIRVPSFAIACTVTACSPTSRLDVRFFQPEGIEAQMNTDLFHLAGSKACPPGVVSAPTAGLPVGDVEYHESESVHGGLHIVAAFRGRRCLVQVAGWYDRNGNGLVDTGDYVGRTVAVEISDRGLFAGNVTKAPDVHMDVVR